MPSMVIKRDGEGAWPDLRDKPFDQVIHLPHEGPSIQVCCLARGMKSGKPSIAFRFELPDGRTVLAETSLALFQMAAAYFKTVFGDVT